MKGRHTVPKRCNRVAYLISPANGYRLCSKCERAYPLEADGLVFLNTGPDQADKMRCDRPTDGLGAMGMLPLAERHSL